MMVQVPSRIRGVMGLGDCTDPTDPSFPCVDVSTPDTFTCPDGLVLAVGETCPALSPGDPGYIAPSSGSGVSTSQIASLISGAGTAATQALNAANAPPGYTYNPTTGRYVSALGVAVAPGTAIPGYTFNPATGQYTAAVSANMPAIIMGIAAVGVLFMFMKR